MNPRLEARWNEIEPWLDRALERPASERVAWLRANCRDPDLCELVAGLLAADTSRGERLEACATAVQTWLAAGGCDLPQVPGYRVLRLLGEGGMASVFLAERMLGQTVQQVALKRLRLNVYDRDERRRFEHEHRILARLEHPHIARLVDAGIAPDGVPWFAMEYVDGQPLVAWCDAHRLGIDARLRLLGQVCGAVHHAHQHLVVHRDLKPSNILVSAEGAAKVLDFGIARLLEPDTGDPDAATRTGLRRLTPGYAAPEQYAGAASTATDVYALGVLLVELSTGTRPLPARESGTDPLRGLVVSPTAAEARDATTRQLQRLLSGEIGAIARKALRTEPQERYGSAQAFSEDLASLREGRPVQARRGDWRYRTACFVRRHKTAAAATAAVALTLVVATAVSLHQAHRAREQAERAQAVQVFVEDMLAPLREGVPRARMPPLDELLAKGVAELDRADRRDPAVYSELLVMFARTYDRMGEIETARGLAQRAHAHSLAAFGADDPRTVQALAMRGRMHARFGDAVRARADLTAARAQMQQRGIEGEPLWMVLDDLGFLSLEDAAPDQAETLFAQAQRQRERLLPAAHPDLALGPAHLAEVSDARGDKRNAFALYRQSYRHCVTHGQANTRQAANYLSRSGLLQCELGRFRAGAEDYLRALAIFDRLDARDHPERMWILANSCSAFGFLDELDRAQRDCDRTLAMAVRLYGKDSKPHTTIRLYRLKLLAAQGRLGEGHAEAASVRARIRAQPGASLVWYGRMYSDVLAVEGDHRAVRDALVGAARDPAFARSTIAPTMFARLWLACTHAPSPACPQDLEARVRSELAEPQYRDNPLNIDALLSLTRLALHGGDTGQAFGHLREIERLATLPHARLRSDHRWLIEARSLRGDALAAGGDIAGARAQWRLADSLFAARYDASHPLRRGLADRLADAPRALASR